MSNACVLLSRRAARASRFVGPARRHPPIAAFLEATAETRFINVNLEFRFSVAVLDGCNTRFKIACDSWCPICILREAQLEGLSCGEVLICFQRTRSGTALALPCVRECHPVLYVRADAQHMVK